MDVVALAYSPDQAARVAGIGRSKLFGEISAGRLIARKCGKRTIVLASDLEAYLNALPQRDTGAESAA